MSELLVIKTAALGDVLRTTSILPGLKSLLPSARITWLTSPAARELVVHHPLVDQTELVDVKDTSSLDHATQVLRRESWDWVISFDDEEPLCRLATELDAPRLSGAFLGDGGVCTYTADAAPWFDMGLLSTHGRAEADRLKRENERTHPVLLAEVLGIEPGRPELPLTDEARAFAHEFSERHGLATGGRRVIGLNTGAGGRWTAKQLSAERTVELGRRLHAELRGELVLLLFGGPEEERRNRSIAEGLAAAPEGLCLVDAGTDNSLLDFAALVGLCDVLVASDSLAMHLAIAQGVFVTAFFAPTSAAEIELYGRGEHVRSTAPDYCSYRPDADNSSITPERLASAVLRCIAEHENQS